MRYFKPHPSQARLRELFDYEHGHGRLTWKIQLGTRGTVGSVAGYLQSKTGYWVIRADGRSYQAHRLTWIWHNGDIPKGKLVDHVNGVKTDNRIENLRPADDYLNGTNKECVVNKKSGLPVGVQAKGDRFQARIKVDGKNKYLGTRSTPEEAGQLYLDALEELRQSED